MLHIKYEYSLFVSESLLVHLGHFLAIYLSEVNLVHIDNGWLYVTCPLFLYRYFLS